MESNNKIRNCLVFGITIVFIGAGVVPSVSGAAEKRGSDKIMETRSISDQSLAYPSLDGWYVQWSHTYGGYGHSQLAQPVGDIDEDGINEVIVGGYGSYGAHILSYNKNSGEYDEEYFWNYPGGGFDGVPSGACVVDLDDNGELELVASFEYGGRNGVYAYDWDGSTLTELDYYTGIGYDFAFDVYACDYDDDEDVEVLIANSPSSGYGYHVTALRWDAANKDFVREISWSSGLSTECPMVWSGDPDDDGKTEVVACAGYNTVYALNYENDSWNAEVVKTGLPDHPYGVGLGDLDNDGIDEIGVGTYGTDAYIFDWDGDSYETVWHMDFTGEQSIIEGTAIGDADNDGQNELLVGTDHIHVISYNGSNYVEESTITYTSGMLAGVNIEDFDTDGWNEVKACDIIEGPGTEWIIKHEGVAMLEIGEIKGGFGVSTAIKNIGTADATNIKWSITLDGGLIILGKETIGSFTSIEAGKEEPVKSDLILGIGKTTIIVHAICDEGSEGTKTANGFVFLFFVIGVK
jgi:hypothetical protein